MAILNLTTNQKSVCAIPDPGIEGKSKWESVGEKVFSLEDIAEDTRSATVEAVDGDGGVGWLTVTTEDETTTVIATLEVRVEGSKVRFAEVSASTPDLKT